MQNETQVQIPDSLMTADNAPAINEHILEVVMPVDTPSEDPISTDTVALHDLEQEQTDDEFQRVQDAGVALESYIELIRQAGRDGISRQAAAILNVGLKHTYSQLGLGQVTTGLEDYVTCSSYDARRSTVVSIEELEEKKKGVLARLWDLILKGLSKVAEFFKKVFSKAEKVKEKAEEVKEKAKESKVVSGTEFEIPEIIAKWVWNSVNDDGTLDLAMTAETEVVEFVTLTLPEAVYDTIEDGFRGEKPSNDRIERVFKEYRTSVMSEGTSIHMDVVEGKPVIEFKTKDNPKIETKLKTRSPHEIHKNVVFIEELVTTMISKPRKGVLAVSKKIEEFAKLNENASNQEREDFVQDTLILIKDNLDYNLIMKVHKLALNIANAKLSAMILELATSKEDNPE